MQFSRDSFLGHNNDTIPEGPDDGDQGKVCLPGSLLTIVQELCESRGGRPGLSVLTEPSGVRERKAILNHASALVSACP